jgi:putative membrane protein
MKILSSMLMLSGVLLVSGALALGQAREPMGGAPGQTGTENNNPNQGINNNANPMAEPPSNQMQDKDFVHSALEGGMAEVQMGQLAEQKASSDDVKQFGQKMVQDHTQIGDQMKQVAQQLGVKEPKGLSKKDKEEVAKLNTLSGEQFDNAYINAMVKDHKKDLSDFKAEAQNTQNPAVKQVAQQGAQVIDQHLQLAEQLEKTHNQMTGSK